MSESESDDSTSEMGGNGVRWEKGYKCSIRKRSSTGEKVILIVILTVGVGLEYECPLYETPQGRAREIPLYARSGRDLQYTRGNQNRHAGGGKSSKKNENGTSRASKPRLCSQQRVDGRGCTCSIAIHSSLGIISSSRRESRSGSIMGFGNN